MEIYSDAQINKEVLQSISEYVACYDDQYFKLNAADVLLAIPEVIHSSFNRSNRVKNLNRNLPHPIEVAENWMVVLKA